MVSDHYVPPEMIRTLESLPTVDVSRFVGSYPSARLDYNIEGCPVSVSVTAWSPLTPGDAEDSSWPVAIFEFELINPGREHSTSVSILSSLQNSIGWDGATPIRGVSHVGYGGNMNRVTQIGDASAVIMTNPHLSDDHPTFGQIVQAALGGTSSACPQWTDIDSIWYSFVDTGTLRPSAFYPPSQQGTTCNSGLCQRVEIGPGETKKITFVVAWHFPNRYVDWVQWEELIPAGKSRLYLGNRYAHRGEPTAWLPDFLKRIPDLRQKTREYTKSLESTLPKVVADAVGSCVANLRSNICLWTEDGRFYGFEGGHGASTWEGFFATIGCCPMNCTHVWNYEQGLVELWPELFRTMRETDWLINQAPDGQVPHRVTLPIYVRKLWNTTIGGPDNPAIDGLFAAVFKTLQYATRKEEEPQGLEWLRSVWPQVKKAMGWVMTYRDATGDGVIRGEQPNTYDIHLYGPNTFIGSQYLAALLAMDRMSGLVGDCDDSYRKRFELGSFNYDEICFNGEFYVQRIPEGHDTNNQYGNGCSSDQLLGQWWAHHLGLGYVLPKANVQSSLRAILKRNFRTSFDGFSHQSRIFASGDESGLLVCSYEPQHRPKVPLMYSDEVWTGIEYAVAALCLHEGLINEGLSIVAATRNRYDGKRRNPFNEVECGDHYIRALSAWSLPRAWNARLRVT